MAMRTRTPAKRLLVFDGENTCHDTWDSASGAPLWTVIMSRIWLGTSYDTLQKCDPR